MYFAWLIALSTPAMLYYIWQTAMLNKRNSILKNLEAIDEVLKTRLNLIPKILIIYTKLDNHDSKLETEIESLIIACKKDYSKYSRDDVAEHLISIDRLNIRIGRIIMNHSQSIKNNPLLAEVLKSYADTESEIAVIRKSYNENVSELNKQILDFPNTLIAEVNKISAMPLFVEQNGLEDKDF